MLECDTQEGKHSWKVEQGSDGSRSSTSRPGQSEAYTEGGRRGERGGGGPHLEPSSLPFLSNSVETLRCIRQEDKENKIDVDCTFLLQLFWFKQKMWQRHETTTENKTTEKHQEVKESASGEEKWWSQTMNSNQWNAADGTSFSEDGTIKAPVLVSLSEQQHLLRVFLRSSEEPTLKTPLLRKKRQF